MSPFPEIQQMATAEQSGSAAELQRALRGALGEARHVAVVLRRAGSLSGEMLMPEHRRCEAERRARVAALLGEARRGVEALQLRAIQMQEPLPAALASRVQELQSRVMEAQWMARQAAIRAERTAAQLSSLDRHSTALHHTVERLRALGSRTGLLTGAARAA